MKQPYVQRNTQPPQRGPILTATRWVYATAYVGASILFAVCGLALLIFASIEIFHGIDPSAQVAMRERFASIVEGIGLLTICVASLELSQTVLEEEVLRDALMSGPTRARRFLSRFMLVVVVSLSVEFLVAVFKLSHTEPERMRDAFYIGAGAALLLLAWGGFVRLNKTAEELEPEAMADAKREDHQVKSS
jgi:uncharacterized membrane protein YqhA